MFIKCLKVGRLETNCYILCDKVHNLAAVIDPGFDARRIAAALSDTECAAEYIIVTHAHYDHIGSVAELKKITGAKLVALDEELASLNDPARNLHDSFDETPFAPLKPEIIMHDGEILRMGLLELQFLHTPGHTAGGCSIVCQDGIFSGDTLFREEVGRTDLPGGSYEALMRSVDRLAALPGEYQVFPGHGDITTLSHERACNPYLNRGDKAP